MLWIAAVAVLGLLFFWSSFSLLARFLGAFLVIDTLLTFALGFGNPERLFWIGVGVLLWVAGHWFWAFKHGLWRTRLAMRAFRLPLLRDLSPIDRRPRTAVQTPGWNATDLGYR